MNKKILKIVIVLLAIYLFISAIYVFNYINFEEPPRFTSPGFSNETNIIRGIMGLPPTYHRRIVSEAEHLVTNKVTRCFVYIKIDIEQKLMLQYYYHIN